MAKYEITGPDGATYDVEAPNDEAVAAATAQMFSGQPPAADPAAPAKPPAPTLTETIMSGLGTADRMGALAGRSVRRGLSNFGGLPVDAVNGLAGLLGAPVSQKPFMGSKFIDDALGGFGVLPEPAPARTGTERVVSRVGEEIGAAVPVVGAAVRAGQMGVEAARKLPILARMFVEPAAINPGAFTRKEMAAAAAAGTGAGLANQATNAMGAKEGNVVHNTGDIAGALAGAGALGVARTTAPMVGDVFNAIFRRDKFSNQQVQQQVTDVLANAADSLPKSAKEPIDTQPLVDSITGNPKVSDTIPGYTESLGDRTKDAGIAATEYSRQTGPNGGLFTQQRQTNTQAVDQALDASAPTGTPGAFRSELDAERTRQIDSARGQTATAQANLDQHLQRLQPAMTGEGRGANIRAALEGASERTREIVDGAWAPLNRSGQSVDVAPLANDFERLGNNMSLAERERFRPREADIPDRLAPHAEPGPDQVRGANDNGHRPPAQHTIQEVTGLRSALTDAAREARTNNKPAEARIIDQHIQALDTYLDNSVPADLRQQYEIAKSLRGDMADRFERPQTAIAQTLDRQQGQYRQPDSAVTRNFVQDDEGNIANFRNLMLETGNDQRTVSAVRDQILADVRDRGLVNNPQQLDEYLGRYSTILGDRRFANVRQELTTAGGLRGALDSTIGAETNLTRTLGTPDTPGTGPVGKYLQYGDEKSTQAMKGVLASKNPGADIDEMLNFAGNRPEAVEGARRTFWDIMQEKARRGGETTAGLDGRQPWMPRALNGFLTDPANRAVAERLYRDNPEHLANVNRIADALQGVDLRSRAKAPNTSGTAQGVNNVLTPETVQSRFYAYKRGQTSLGFMVTALASVAARRAVRGAQSEAVEKLLDRALLDPELAAQLLKENNPANRAAMARTAKAFLGNEASTLFDMMDGDEPDPVKAAAMKKDVK